MTPNGFPGSSMYHAIKWGIEGFAEAVAAEVAPFGIGITIVEPGGAASWSAAPPPQRAARPRRLLGEPVWADNRDQRFTASLNTLRAGNSSLRSLGFSGNSRPLARRGRAGRPPWPAIVIWPNFVAPRPAGTA
jgi:NAD(P)-dependent dehydrogenase (short-subunit alcohol dehydrogenase family)